MTLHDIRSVHSSSSPALVRFVASGLLATIESFLRGGLPLPRLARELHARTDTLAELHPPARTLTRLHWLHREVSRLDSALHGAGRTELEPHERAHLEVTLGTLRDTLATLLTLDPLDPAGAARPAEAPALVAGGAAVAARADRAAAAAVIPRPRSHTKVGQAGRAGLGQAGPGRTGLGQAGRLARGRLDVATSADDRPPVAWPWPTTSEPDGGAPHHRPAAPIGRFGA